MDRALWAFPSSAPSLLGVLALGELLDDLGAKGVQVAGINRSPCVSPFVVRGQPPDLSAPGASTSTSPPSAGLLVDGLPSRDLRVFMPAASTGAPGFSRSVCPQQRGWVHLLPYPR
jgi:hypothetical protein